MLSSVFEPSIPTSELLQANSLDRAANRIGLKMFTDTKSENFEISVFIHVTCSFVRYAVLYDLVQPDDGLIKGHST